MDVYVRVYFFTPLLNMNDVITEIPNIMIKDNL